MNAACEHLALVGEVTPSAIGCAHCLRTDDSWWCYRDNLVYGVPGAERAPSYR
jgi:hypothetical protein